MLEYICGLRFVISSLGVQVEPVNEQLFATACSDNSVAVWDWRKLSKGGKPISTVSHSLTCQSAFFAPDGMHLNLN